MGYMYREHAWDEGRHAPYQVRIESGVGYGSLDQSGLWLSLTLTPTPTPTPP